MGAELMQRAAYTEGRPAYDKFDAMAKPREAQEYRAEGAALLQPKSDRVIAACGEAMLQDAGDPGVSLD